MFDFQTAINTSEKVFGFIQNTYQGRTPPVDFFIEAWTRTSHIFSERLRMTANAKLKAIVADGPSWEGLWTSYSPALSGHAGHHGVDASPQINAEIQAARALARAAQSHRDRERNSGKEGRTHKGKGKSAKGKGQGKGQGKKTKKRGNPWKGH